MTVKLSSEQIARLNALHQQLSNAENGLNAVLRNADQEGGLPDAVLVPLHDGLVKTLQAIAAMPPELAAGAKAAQDVVTALGREIARRDAARMENEDRAGEQVGG